MPGELAPIVMPQHPLFMDDGLFKKIENNTKEIRTVIKFMHKSKVDPVTSVMVTYRDGSKHLMPQTGEVGLSEGETIIVNANEGHAGQVAIVTSPPTSSQGEVNKLSIERGARSAE